MAFKSDSHYSHLSYRLKFKILKVGHIYLGTNIGVAKGDARSLDPEPHNRAHSGGSCTLSEALGLLKV